MSSPVYQNVVSLIVRLPIRRRPSNFVNVTMCKHRTFDRFFYVAKLTTLTPLLLLISCKLSFPIVGVKISPLPTFALKSNKNVHTVLNLSNTCSSSSWNLSFMSSILSSVGVWTFCTVILHQRPS
jgi:hypothetical protein